MTYYGDFVWGKKLRKINIYIYHTRSVSAVASRDEGLRNLLWSGKVVVKLVMLWGTGCCR